MLTDRQKQFFLAFGLGLACLMTVHVIDIGLSRGGLVLVPVNLFFACYLVLMARQLHLTQTDLQNRALRENNWTGLVVVLAAISLAASTTAAVLVLNQTTAGHPIETVLALIAVPLGWMVIHTMAAFHYAYRFYQPVPGKVRRGGLSFPQEGDPDLWDFLYFAFVIGISASVSDVNVTDSAMRRTVLGHSVVSFLANTVTVALAVNAAMSVRL
jgi:uncharacterized membrane protein